MIVSSKKMLLTHSLYFCIFPPSMDHCCVAVNDRLFKAQIGGIERRKQYGISEVG